MMAFHLDEAGPDEARPGEESIAASDIGAASSVPRIRAMSRRTGLDATAALILIPVAANLWFMRHMLWHVSWPNDVPFHVSMTQWAADRMGHGQLPLDGWYPRLSGGYPQFHMYQSVPHLITAAFGKIVGVESAFNLSTWLLWGTWPICVFIAARAFGLNKSAAIIAAFLAPLLTSPVSYGYELGSYSWIGYGLWSQLWGMWAFPLALAWSARAVAEGRRFGRAGLAMAVLVATHLPTAWFAVLAIGLWVLVRPAQFRYRIPRTLLMGFGSVLVSAWILIPLVTDQWAGLASSFNVDKFADSFGWRKVLGFFASGDINDNGRWPVISVAAAVGLVVAISKWRRPPVRWARELPFLLVCGTVLFVGRNPFGPLIDLLPGSDLVFLHRYHIVIHLVSLLLAGAGIAWAGEAIGRAMRARGANLQRIDLVNRSATVALALAVIIPAAAQVHGEMVNDRNYVESQVVADKSDGRDVASLVALANQRGGGRVYGGRTNNWGNDAKVGSTPLPILLGYYPVDQIGYNLRVAGLSADLETYLNDQEPAQLRLLGIKYVLVPRSHPVPSELTLLAAKGLFYLYEVPDSRWMEAVNVVGPEWNVRRNKLGETVLDALGSTALQGADRRLMSLGGRSGTSVVSPPSTPGSPDAVPGRIVDSKVDTAAGHFDASVVMTRPGAIIAKTNWHPRWTAFVDNKPAETFMVNPMQLAVHVPNGSHEVSFRYRAYSWYWLWMLIGSLTLFAMYIVPRRARRSNWGWWGVSDIDTAEPNVRYVDGADASSTSTSDADVSQDLVDR